MPDYPTFNIYKNCLSFDGRNILVVTISGDLFLQFLNNNYMGLSWIPSPYKHTQQDIREENFGITNVAFENEMVVLVYKRTELWISKDNKMDKIEAVEKVDDTFKTGFAEFGGWTQYTNPGMSEDEKYVLIKFFDQSFIFIMTYNKGVYKSYILDIEDKIFHDVTNVDETEINYKNRIVFVLNPENPTKNVIAYSVTENKQIQLKSYNIPDINFIAGSFYAKQLMFCKNDEIYSIPYEKFFNNSTEYTRLDVKFEDNKEFVTSFGVTTKFYVIATYKNIYVKSIHNNDDANNEWVSIPFISESSFDIKTINKNENDELYDENYDVTNIFWTNVNCVGDNVILTSIDGKIYCLVIEEKLVLTSILPQLFMDDCSTNQTLKESTFLNKYKIEYSEFECKCKTKHT